MSRPTTSRDVYPLAVCDRVYDRKQIADEGEPELAIVVETLDEDVHERTFTRDGEEVPLADYGPNRQYSKRDASDRVVKIAFTGWLNAYVTGWDEYQNSPDQLQAALDRAESEWGVPVSSHLYDYPEARLMLVYRPATENDIPSQQQESGTH